VGLAVVGLAVACLAVQGLAVACLAVQGLAVSTLAAGRGDAVHATSLPQVRAPISRRAVFFSRLRGSWQKLSNFLDAR